VVPAALLPAISLIAGTAGGISFPLPWRLALCALPLLAVAAIVTWRRRSRRTTIALIASAFGCAGAVLGAQSREAAFDTPLRALLDRDIGGFNLDTFRPPGNHDPIPTRLLLTEDASPGDQVTTLRADVLAIRLHGKWLPAAGGVVLSVGGQVTIERVGAWRRGRTIEAPITFRRPARYLDEGVADFERQSALDGVTLLGSIKSALLIDILERGTVLHEVAADVRAEVRDRVGRRVSPHSTLSAAIVSAVLIGDRSGLPDEVRTRLQAAGTYHVIAISGGNIAILAAVILLALGIAGTSGRRAALVTLVALIGYAQVVTAGPSVWRATLVAVVYLVARLLDHRTAPWQSMAVAGGLLACVHPLDVRNAGFILTFGATGALLEVARQMSMMRTGPSSTMPRGPSSIMRRGSSSIMRRGPSGPRSPVMAWLTTSVAASAAVEIVLLPVMAITFARVTVAGLLLNLAAVPLMAVVQLAGLAIVCADTVDLVARPAAWFAHLGAAGIVESARLVDVAPWLTRRVPPPSIVVVIAYYSGLAALLLPDRRLVRLGGAACLAIAGVWIVAGVNPVALPSADASVLRLTMFDVGQGDAMALQVPDGVVRPFAPGVGRPFTDSHTIIVDTGGSPFGNGGFDIGARVVEPALWATGVRSLQRLLLTHGDPDHIGGAAALIDDFRPDVVWQGIPVPRAVALQTVLARAAEARSRVEERSAGEELTLGAVRIRVLHPPPPDWERQRVRNDDSVVLEVLYGDVALLLTGDIGSAIEHAIVPQLTPAKTRILKVAHHGSRTSTSQELLDAWRPQIALISCGRGNPFGHPAPEVVERLIAAGVTVYRTDRDGEITVETDGEHVFVRTFAGGKR
jgi:competence protein ComEC